MSFFSVKQGQFECKETVPSSFKSEQRHEVEGGNLIQMSITDVHDLLLFNHSVMSNSATP